ncbi:MAG: YdcH family protein [Stellaceae bacterium]
MDLDVEALKARIAALKGEHRDLDEAIGRLSDTVPVNHLHLQRLKKRKLALKDLILKLEAKLLPDIIA